MAAQSQGIDQPQRISQLLPRRQRAGRLRDEHRLPAGKVEQHEGFAKLVTDPKGRILGAAIVGPHAGELIAEYALALAKGMSASDISSAIHVYPTLASISRRVADQRMKEGLTPAAKRWIRRLFRLQGV